MELRTHRCRAERVTSRNGCSSATAALFTSSSNGPAAPTAASTASQSARSRQRLSMPGHCGESGRGGREAGSGRGGQKEGSVPPVPGSPSPPPFGSAPLPGPRPCSAPQPRRDRSLRGDGVRLAPAGPLPPALRPGSPLPAPVTRARRPRKLRCGSMLELDCGRGGAGQGARSGPAAPPGSASGTGTQR